MSMRLKDIRGWDIDLNARFFSKVDKTAECWIWNAARQALNYKSGYGVIRVYINGKRTMIGAHRLSYIMHHGELDNNLFVCHTCDNPLCVNPDHLFLGTQKDNIHDAVLKGRHFHAELPGELNPAAKLTEPLVEGIKLLHKEGFGTSRLARMYGVHRTTIQKIMRNKTWRDI